MPEQRRVYAAWFEGLFVRALGHRLTPVLIDELRAAGLDLEKPLLTTYSSEVRVACVRLLREHLFAGQSDDAAYFAIGRATVDGFLHTLVGQTIAAVVRLLGPRATLKRVGTILAAASNFVTATPVERGPFRWEITVRNGDLPPSYFLGLARATLDLHALSEPRVEVVRRSEDALVVGLGWSPGDAVSTR